MKKFLAVFLVAVFLACFTCFVVGCNEKSSKGSSSTENPTEGIIYEVDHSGEFAVVVNYKGEAENVVIASTYNGVPVTKIGKEAFFEDPVIPPYLSEKIRIKSVVMPQSITEIGERAFACTYLSKVKIPDRVTSIGSYAFRGCDSLTSVEIGDSVTSIGDEAFYYCYSLTSVTFNDTSNWFAWDRQTQIEGDIVDVTDPSQNATYLKSTYYNYYWYKK